MSSSSWITTTLTARDFATTTTEANRNTWTRGQLDAVVAALGGQQVLVVVDKGTGFTLLATLERTTDGSFTNAHGALRVVTEHNVTDYRVTDIGAIVVMPGQDYGPRGPRSAHWLALDNYRALQTEGIRAAKAYVEDHPELADLALSYDATPYGGGRVGWAITQNVGQPDGTRREHQVAYGTLTGVSLEPTPAP